jgi:hypothetical protein
MAKYREKIEPMVVDIVEWNPAKGKKYEHIAVASERAADGTFLGAIHKSDGSTIWNIKPGTLIVTYPTKPPTYTIIKNDEVDAFFELVVEMPAISNTPALAADNGEQTLDEVS